MKQKALGILGGLGPLASVEFLKTIYELNLTDSEQESPICFLYSNPTIPKRSETIAAGKSQILLDFLIAALEQLCQMGSTKIVIVCLTMHHFLPQLPAYFQDTVISLVDIIIKEVLKHQHKYLLLSSTGTHQTNIFTRHPQWNLIEPYLILPKESDRDLIHNCFEEIKINSSKKSALEFVDKMVDKYEVDGWIGACSELHILHKYLLNLEGRKRADKIIDPLLILAQNFNDFLN